MVLGSKDPVVPLSPGRAERHGFEYFRHGTRSLYAAFNTKTGERLGNTARGRRGRVGKVAPGYVLRAFPCADIITASRRSARQAKE